MKKKRLLFLVSRMLQGGIDTLLIQYLKHIDRNAYEITLGIGTCMEELEKCRPLVPEDVRVVYLVENHHLVKYRKLKVIEKLPIHKKLYSETVLSGVRRFIQQRTLNRLLKVSDVVIDYDCSFYSFLKNTPLPKVAFFHFSFKRYHHGNRRKLARLGAKMEVYNKIVTICNDMRDEGLELFPHLKEKFVTIYNGVDISDIQQRARQEVAPTPPTNTPYLLAVQRLQEEQKDGATLIRAYQLLRQQYGITLPLYFLGDGKDRGTLEQLCQQLQVAEQVHFIGYCGNPFPWIARCSCLVLSSKFEGLPVVLIEAMVLNRMIVSSDCPTGPAEILNNGKAGALVPIGNTEAMAAAIYRALTDTCYQQELEKGRQVQVEKFALSTILQEITLLINAL